MAFAPDRTAASQRAAVRRLSSINRERPVQKVPVSINRTVRGAPGMMLLLELAVG